MSQAAKLTYQEYIVAIAPRATGDEAVDDEVELNLREAEPHESGRRRTGAPRTVTVSIPKFLTCGNVDDGKSTLPGRMMSDGGLVPQDTIILSRVQIGKMTSPAGYISNPD